MKTSRNMAAYIITAVILTACGGGSRSSSMSDGNPIAALETAGKLPKLDRTDSLLGVDADRNGIRDDIDAYINALTTAPQNKAAARQMARSAQDILVLVESGSIGDPIAAKTVKIKGTRAIHCVFSRMPITTQEGWEITNNIEKMTFNTKTRAKSYLQYNRALSGTTWALPNEDTCE